MDLLFVNKCWIWVIGLGKVRVSKIGQWRNQQWLSRMVISMEEREGMWALKMNILRLFLVLVVPMNWMIKMVNKCVFLIGYSVCSISQFLNKFTWSRRTELGIQDLGLQSFGSQDNIREMDDSRCVKSSLLVVIVVGLNSINGSMIRVLLHYLIDGGSG